MGKILVKPYTEDRTSFSGIISLPGHYRNDVTNEYLTLTSDMEVRKSKDGTAHIDKASHIEFAGREDKVYDDTENPDIREFFFNNPLCYLEGGENQNMKRRLFYVVDVEEKNTRKKDRYLYKVKVANTLKQMSYDRLADVVFGVGLNPAQKSSEEIFVILMDMIFGDDKPPNPGVDVIDKFLRQEDKEFLVDAKKALSYGIVSIKNSNIFMNEEYIGTTVEELAAYLQKNPKQYNNAIKKKIKEHDPKYKASAPDGKVTSGKDGK